MPLNQFINIHTLYVHTYIASSNIKDLFNLKYRFYFDPKDPLVFL